MMEPSDSDSLKAFISESKNCLQRILRELQWTKEDTMKCFNSNSIAALNMDKKSSNSMEDYEESLPVSCATENSVTIVLEDLRNIVEDTSVEIPQKFSDLQLNFNREQKCKIYDHVIKHTTKCVDPLIDANPLLSEDGRLNFAEIVAKEKRERKKRRKYRTSKPTRIEEIRGLIELQMDAFQQFLKDTERVRETRKRDGNHRRRSRSAGSRGHRRSRSRDYDRKRPRRELDGREREHRESYSRSRERHKHKRSYESRHDSNIDKSHDSRHHNPHKSHKSHKSHKRSRSRSRERRR